MLLLCLLEDKYFVALQFEWAHVILFLCPSHATNIQDGIQRHFTSCIFNLLLDVDVRTKMLQKCAKHVVYDQVSNKNEIILFTDDSAVLDNIENRHKPDPPIDNIIVFHIQPWNNCKHKNDITCKNRGYWIKYVTFDSLTISLFTIILCALF